MNRKTFKMVLVSIGLALLSLVLRDAPEKTGELLVDFWSEE
jgi:hypothetical protein